MLVEYSLSPEFKFPIANEQVYAALCWVRENGDTINVNSDQIAIAGDSAGGNMTTVVSSKLKSTKKIKYCRILINWYSDG